MWLRIVVMLLRAIKARSHVFFEVFYMQVLGLTTRHKKLWRSFVQDQDVVQFIYFQNI